MDDLLYKALGAKARQENRSISQEVIVMIKAYLSNNSRVMLSQTEQFLNICGTWEDSRSEQEIVAELRDERTENSNREVEI